jgi:hypothetical protein
MLSFGFCCAFCTVGLIFYPVSLPQPLDTCPELCDDMFSVSVCIEFDIRYDSSHLLKDRSSKFANHGTFECMGLCLQFLDRQV